MTDPRGPRQLHVTLFRTPLGGWMAECGQLGCLAASDTSPAHALRRAADVIERHFSLVEKYSLEKVTEVIDKCYELKRSGANAGEIDDVVYAALGDGVPVKTIEDWIQWKVWNEH